MTIEKFFHQLFVRAYMHGDWMAHKKKELKIHAKLFNIQKLEQPIDSFPNVHQYTLEYKDCNYLLTIINIKWASIFRDEGPIVYMSRSCNNKISKRLIQYDSNYIIHSKMCDLNLPFSSDINKKFGSYDPKYHMCVVNYNLEKKIRAHFKQRLANVDMKAFNLDKHHKHIVQINIPNAIMLQHVKTKRLLKIGDTSIEYSYRYKGRKYWIRFSKSNVQQQQLLKNFSRLISVPVGPTGNILNQV